MLLAPLVRPAGPAAHERETGDQQEQGEGPEEVDRQRAHGDVLRVEFERSLQTIDPLLGSVHCGAQPHPVGCIVLIGLEQTREQFTCPGFFSLP